MVRKIFYFVLIVVVSFFTQIFSNDALADTMYGARLVRVDSFWHRIRLIINRGLVISFVPLFFYLISVIVGFFRNKFTKVSLDYTRLEPNDKVKITYIRDGKDITQKVRIATIDDEKVSFYYKKEVRECPVSRVISIKEYRRHSKFFWINVIIFVIFLLLTIAFSAIYYVVGDPCCIDGSCFSYDGE